MWVILYIRPLMLVIPAKNTLDKTTTHLIHKGTTELVKQSEREWKRGHNEVSNTSKEEWYHIDKSGRKIGWMYPEDMEAIAESIWGARKWVDGLSFYLRVDRSKIDNWRHGRTAIPKSIALLFEMIQDRGINLHKLPQISAPWLPPTTGANGRTEGEKTTDSVLRLDAAIDNKVYAKTR